MPNACHWTALRTLFRQPVPKAFSAYLLQVPHSHAPDHHGELLNAGCMPPPDKHAAVQHSCLRL